MTPSEPSLDDPDDLQPSLDLDRRRALQWMGRLSLAGLLGACGVRNDRATNSVTSTITSSSSTDSATTPVHTSTSTTADGPSESESSGRVAPLTADMFAALAVCTTLSETAAGPFPLDETAPS